MHVMEQHLKNQLDLLVVALLYADPEYLEKKNHSRKFKFSIIVMIKKRIAVIIP